MSQEQKQISYAEYIATLRNQIVISYDNAKEVALRNFDDVSKKWGEQLATVQSLKTALENQAKKPETKKEEKKK